jgi:hypothetical protein
MLGIWDVQSLNLSMDRLSWFIALVAKAGIAGILLYSLK